MHTRMPEEMRRALRECGWHNYSLFINSEGLVVAYVETDDFELAAARLARRAAAQQWHEAVAPMLIRNDADDVVGETLSECFHVH